MNGGAADFWERHYRSLDADWGTRPNAQLTRMLDILSLAPARALDLGCGHGGDALELARRGWEVTAVDVSATAIERVSQQAAALRLPVHAEARDLEADVPGGAFELVTASYLHADGGLRRERALQRAADHVPVGGVLLVIDHGSIAPWSWNQDAHEFPSPEQTYQAIGLPDGWEPRHLERASRVATGPNGEVAEVADIVVAARRAH